MGQQDSLLLGVEHHRHMMPKVARIAEEAPVVDEAHICWSTLVNISKNDVPTWKTMGTPQFLNVFFFGAAPEYQRTSSPAGEPSSCGFSLACRESPSQVSSRCRFAHGGLSNIDPAIWGHLNRKTELKILVDVPINFGH